MLSALDPKSPQLLPTCIPISCGRRKPACTRFFNAVAAPAVQSTIIAAQFSMHWSAKFPERPRSVVGSQYSTVSQHRLSWFVGWEYRARSPGREHTLTYGRRRMAFLLGLSSCNSNPPLHARRLVSNLIGEWNKDGERAKADGRRTEGPLNKFPAKVTAPLLHLGQTISTAFFVVAYFRAE